MSTSYKANRVLKFFLFAFLVITLRVWHLGVIQREDKLLEAQKPQQRTVLVRANRGPIYDRFGVPMALNRISYNATVYYSQIAQVPTIVWQSDGDGKQIKVYSRKQYVKKLSNILAQTLNLDAERVEDLIYSKAALFPHVPFLVKSGLTEEEHYRLRMLEKDWPGVYAEIASRRYYPQGKVGCNIVGTLGAISQKEYLTIAQEISELKMTEDLYGLDESHRLAELKEKAYTVNDLIGKTGVEAYFEEDLRGFFGKKTYEVDQKGCFVREIAEKQALPGKKLILTISSELQHFAESLLAKDEKIRDGRSLGTDPVDKKRKSQKQPWIKGGAIVALDPNTGEILALASYPRFDPNDFIAGNVKQINRWLETQNHIASLWDGRDVLTRERGRKVETQPLTWDFYLETILPKDGPLKAFFKRCDDIKSAIQLQEDYEALLYFTNSGLPVPTEIQKRLNAINLSEPDKLFAADVCRMAVYAPAFTDSLIEQIGSMKISTYRSLCQSFLKEEAHAKQIAQQEFRANEFRAWKDVHQKQFLNEKRKKEKEAKTYARPYIDYLDQKEKELFAAHWENERMTKLSSQTFSEDLIRTFRSFSELNRPLLGKYRKFKSEKDLAAAFYPRGGFGFTRSLAYEAGLPPGSVFKLVTGYEGLRQGKNPTIIDERSKTGVAYTPNRILYPRFYKGGRLPRSAAISNGKIDLIGALERTSNPYFAILAGDYFEDPEDLAKAAKAFGFGEKTGIELPREKRGNIPTDLKTNRTGLYSASIGQHTLLTTPLQTALMIASISNGGKLFKPKIIKEAIGFKPDRKPLEAFAASSYLAKGELNAIGIPFPLFTSTQSQSPILAAVENPIEIQRTLPIDSKIRKTLLEGMDRVVWGEKGSARPTRIKGLVGNPILKNEFLSLKHQMVGKTGTAELLCNFSANPSAPAQMYKYIWFGAASFTDLLYADPELVVVVMLKYGDAGREAAPIAAQMIHKWREIKKKHSSD